MPVTNSGHIQSLDGIVWDNWGIVEILAERRNKLREQLIDALYNEIADEEAPSEGKAELIVGEVKKRVAGRGIETKYTMQPRQENGEGESFDAEQISLGAITVDFPAKQDGQISLEVTASLPQQKIFGNGLDDSKKHIRRIVERNTSNSESESTSVNEESVNISDLDHASGRNDIARRIILAQRFFGSEVEPNVGEFVQEVMGIYRIYKQIPQWLTELESR